MKKATKKYKKLDHTADLLEKFAQGIVNSIALVINDLFGAKRTRRNYARR
jgi:hypothetical protein